MSLIFRKIRIAAIIITSLIYIYPGSIFAQLGGDWQTISSMNEVRGMTFLNGRLWASTSGGMFSFDTVSGDIDQYTNNQGLQSINLNCIAKDDKGSLIVGGDNGVVQVYSPEIDNWEFEFSIRGFNIEQLLVRQDTLWAAAGKGLAVFVWNGSSYLFFDYFLNFNILPNEVFCVEYYNGKIWLGTDLGLLSAPADLSKYTINDPDLWRLYTTQDGLVTNKIYDLEVFDNKLFVGMYRGLAWIDNTLKVTVADNWPKLSNQEYYPAVNITAAQNKIFVSNFPHLLSYTIDGGAQWIKTFPSDVESIAIDEAENSWAGLNGGGFYKPQWDSPKKLDSPAVNSFRCLYKRKDGSIWASSGKPKVYAGRGFFIKDQQGWHNYSFNGGNWVSSNNTVSFYEDCFNNVWISSWGGGLMVFRGNDEVEFFNNNTDTGELSVEMKDTTFTQTLIPDTTRKDYFSGVSKNNKYVVIPQVTEGPEGRLWVANYGATNDKLIVSIPYNSSGFVDTDTSKWISFGRDEGIETSEGDIMCIEFDDYGRLWIGTFTSGVYVLDYNNSLSNKNDDNLDHLLMQDNLASDLIYSIATDNDGIVWIGTAGGLNSFDGLNVYSHVGDPLGETGPLENQINQIFVDRYNNKWFATSGGVSILRAGKSAWDSDGWLGISEENSGLVDNMVQGIYVDPKTSEALIGTDNGLSVYTGAFGQIKSDFSDAAGGPNPFIVENAGSMYILTKLKLNSTVKIFTISGKLVRELSPSNKLKNGSLSVDGGRAVWDGLDLNGETVSTGIYLYMAYTEDGKSTSGKIAVIRK